MPEKMAYLVRQRDNARFDGDVILRYNADLRFEVTSHEVESGAEFSDHIQQKPTELSVDVVITQNPRRRARRRGGRQHVANKYDFLKETAEAKDLVSVVTTDMGTFKNMAIMNLPREVNGIRAWRFTLMLKQIRIATANFITITVNDVTSTTNPSDQDDPTDDQAGTEAGAPDEVDGGEQPTESNDGSEQESDDQSALLILFG